MERHHGTHHDRLVKKMRRLAICDYESANRSRFAIATADPSNMHEPLRRKLDLDSVFCLEHRRIVGNDWVVRFENSYSSSFPIKSQPA